MDRVERLNVRLVQIIAGVYAALSLIGFLAFVSSRAVSRTQPVADPPGELSEDVNLAALDRGAWIEASSYAYLYIHHPLFVIDGLTDPPSTKEQWVPDKSDDAPSFSVHLGRPSRISQVVVYHDPRYADRDYILSCSLGGEVRNSASGAGHREPRVVYDLACDSADEVRLDFTWDPEHGPGHIRIYEIMVIGR